MFTSHYLILPNICCIWMWLWCPLCPNVCTSHFSLIPEPFLVYVPISRLQCIHEFCSSAVSILVLELGYFCSEEGGGGWGIVTSIHIDSKLVWLWNGLILIWVVSVSTLYCFQSDWLGSDLADLSWLWLDLTLLKSDLILTWWFDLIWNCLFILKYWNCTNQVYLSLMKCVTAVYL